MASYAYQTEPIVAYENLYGPPPQLQHQLSSETTKSEGPAQISTRAEWARRRKVYGAIYVPVLFLFTALTAVIVILPLYVFSAHEASLSRNENGKALAIRTAAPLAIVLTISQIASHTIGICVAVAMVIESFHLAAIWLQTQNERPTPLQLGLISGAVQSANILALFSNLSFMFGFTKDARRQQIRSTPLLRQATRKLVALVAGAYLVAIFDSYLHASAKPVPFANISPYQVPAGQSIPSYGRTMNRTMCPEYEDAGAEARLCMFVDYNNTKNSFNLEGEGTRVFTNTSSFMTVGWTKDSMAVALPSPIPSNVTYTARAMAIQTTCESVTMSCLIKENGTYGDGNVPNFGCDSSVNMNITDVFQKNDVAALGDNGNVATPPGNISDNPFRVGTGASSYLYASATGERHVYNDTTGFFYHGPTGYNFALCNVLVLDALYRLEVNGSITHLNSTKAGLADTQRVATTLDTKRRPIQSILLQRTEGKGLLPNTSYLRSLERELSGDLVAMMSWPLAPVPVMDIQKVRLVPGSELKIIPAVLMLSAQIYFTVLCIYITISAIRAASNTPYTRLARTKLFDPLAIVHALHGPRDPERDWEDDPLAMFAVETEKDELMVGPKEAYTTQGRAVMFGVTRRPVAYTQEGDVQMPQPYV